MSVEEIWLRDAGYCCAGEWNAPYYPENMCSWWHDQLDRLQFRNSGLELSIEELVGERDDAKEEILRVRADLFNVEQQYAELQEEADGLNQVIDEYINMYVQIREGRDEARELARRFYNEKQDILDGEGEISSGASDCGRICLPMNGRPIQRI